MDMRSKRLLATLSVVAAIGLATVVRTQLLNACPFCAASGQTLSQEMEAANAAVLARLAEPAEPAAPQGEDAVAGTGVAVEGADDSDRSTVPDPVRKRSFEIVQVLKGSDLVEPGQVIEALYFGETSAEASYFLTAVSVPALEWATPIALTPRGKKYIQRLADLPPQGADRLEFFQAYLMDEETLLAQDAYDEFAGAPYQAVKDLREQMDREQLRSWLQQAELSASRRRLFLTMLGVCGDLDDVPLLEQMLNSEKREYKNGLDALIACYLTLKGASGMPLIEDRFLKNKDADYGDTYAAIMALRFHGEEGGIIGRPRLLEGLRHMLERPDLADLVIIDLARWQDWSVLDQLVELFDAADEKTSWIRAPVVNYLLAAEKVGDDAVKERATAAIQHCESVDAKAVKQAKAYAAFGGGLARPKTKESADASTEKPADEQPAAVQSDDTETTASSAVAQP